MRAKARKNMWYLDSGCSHHMTGERAMFSSISPKDGGYVTFGDNAKGKIVGEGKVGKSPNTTIENVLLVDGLKHNLLSISQFCDKDYKVVFESNKCVVFDKNECALFVGTRHNNIYVVDLYDSKAFNEKCLVSVNDDTWLWHRRLGHVSMHTISKLSKKNLVKGLPKLTYKKDLLCDACVKGKHQKSSFQSKNLISTTRPLELLHMDLFGPSNTLSLGGKAYCFVIVDDYSRFTWVFFLSHKNEAFHMFASYSKKVQNEKGYTITSIRSDRGGEFSCEPFESYCEEHGILHNFSAPRTPQQNGVVERKNRTLQEMARTMLNENGLPKYF